MAWDKKQEYRKITGRPWRRLRDAVLLRDKYTCQSCNRVFTPDQLACDHKVPLSQQGSDNMHNLQALCTGCHEVKTLRESGIEPRQAIGVDGWPTM